MTADLPPLNFEDHTSPPLCLPNEPFAWPMPRVPGFPEASPQSETLNCEILGLNGRKTRGRLTFFVPEEEVAHVQVPPARVTITLRFEQFQMLTLTQPLSAERQPASALEWEVFQAQHITPFQLLGEEGRVIEGQTWSYQEHPWGLFLFLPSQGSSVLRAFVPRKAYREALFGKRIGEMLVESQAVTPEQVAQAVSVQSQMRGQRLGDILLAKQVVSTHQLHKALEQQARMPMVRIGEALVSMGMITREQLGQALHAQRQDRELPLGQVLVNLGFVTKSDLHAAMARKMGYPIVDLTQFPIEPEALKRLRLVVCQKMHILPISVCDGRLVVAVEDPSTPHLLEEVEFAAQCRAILVVGQVDSFSDFIEHCYAKLGLAGAVGGSLTAGAAAALSLDTDKSVLLESLAQEQAASPAADEEAPIEQSDNTLVRLINSMILEAHRDGASDIHIESYPGREKIRIRFRKDGLLRHYLELPHTYRSALVARIKVMCDLDISEKRKPQDGKIDFTRFVPGHKLELRVATIPTHSGMEDVVLRLLASAKPLPLDSIGLSARNLRELERAVEKPYGLVLCVGPTGSGKTTTLHSALSHINVPERKIWTAEDPVEITQPGLRQVQVNPKIDWTFAKALRAFLRADPDVVMVGEMRDRETAGMAVEASLTGHLVLSTLHTNSAPETVVRLLDMGLDPFNFADALLAVLAQRLVRRLCPQCRVQEAASDSQVQEWLADYASVYRPETPRPSEDTILSAWRAQYGVDGVLQAWRSPGCSHCGQTGYKGRLGLHELLVVSKEQRHLIQTGGHAEALQQLAVQEGMTTLRQDGLEKVLAGKTTLEEVRSTTNA